MLKGSKLVANKDTICMSYIHEVTNHYREGLVKLELKKGDEVELIEEWNNFYGKYYRVKHNNNILDILVSDLNPIT